MFALVGQRQGEPAEMEGRQIAPDIMHQMREKGFTMQSRDEEHLPGPRPTSMGSDSPSRPVDQLLLFLTDWKSRDKHLTQVRSMISFLSGAGVQL